MTNPNQYNQANFVTSFMKYNSVCGNKANMFQFCPNNSDEHEDTKYKLYKELIKKGYIVYVECEFKSGLRPDIVAIPPDKHELPKIFEIVCSETEKSKTEKINKYPIHFELSFIETTKSPEICV